MLPRACVVCHGVAALCRAAFVVLSNRAAAVLRFRAVQRIKLGVCWPKKGLQVVAAVVLCSVTRMSGRRCAGQAALCQIACAHFKMTIKSTGQNRIAG